ncbi:MAG: hypothetical protein ACTSUE_04145 [Promethearchaeota archaeon]
MKNLADRGYLTVELHDLERGKTMTRNYKRKYTPMYNGYIDIDFSNRSIHFPTPIQSPLIPRPKKKKKKKRKIKKTTNKVGTGGKKRRRRRTGKRKRKKNDSIPKERVKRRKRKKTR